MQRADSALRRNARVHAAVSVDPRDRSRLERRIDARPKALARPSDFFVAPRALERVLDVDFMPILPLLPYDLEEVGLVDEAIAVAQASGEILPRR